MSETWSSRNAEIEIAALRERTRLSLEHDVDVCIVGAGLAGLSVALQCARLGASVAVLEGRHLGWNASGHHLGTVMPGFGLPASELVERVGREATRELWALSREGAELVRANARELKPGVALSEGVLKVSNAATTDQLMRRLQVPGEDLAKEAEGWEADRVRDHVRTDRYLGGVYYPKAFQVDPRKYLFGLAQLAWRAGARIFEDTPVVSFDSSGIRKRIVTPDARLRATHIVLAGNVHLGAPLRRLSDTLLPVWRYAAVTAPLGDRLAEAIPFKGSVIDADGIDHFCVIDGGRLMWASPETTWAMRPQRFAAAIERRIGTIFPKLGTVEIADAWAGEIGCTVHGMPQIGELRKGLWVASGFGRQGLNTTAMAGQLIARGIVLGEERWKAFSSFELVWAGGSAGRVTGYVMGAWARGSSAVAGAIARKREHARRSARQREARLARARAAAQPKGSLPAA